MDKAHENKERERGHCENDLSDGPDFHLNSKLRLEPAIYSHKKLPSDEKGTVALIVRVGNATGGGDPLWDCTTLDRARLVP